MLGPSWGMPGCSEHLEEATRRVIAERLSTSDLLVAWANQEVVCGVRLAA
jgi:hypothetical protein